MEKFKGHVEVSGITQKGFSRQNNEDNFQIGPYYKKSSSDDTAQYTYSTESGAGSGQAKEEKGNTAMDQGQDRRAKARS